MGVRATVLPRSTLLSGGKVGDRMAGVPEAEHAFPAADRYRTANIMIGPGLAWRRSAGSCRNGDAVGARAGRNWLVFGHRNTRNDFLYQLEWQDLLKRNVLTRLDVAFSRESAGEALRVSMRCGDVRRELYAWVRDGAVIYVCGDANAMAKDVHVMLDTYPG